MANKLKNCKTCGKEMATSAKICPNCGAKNKKLSGAWIAIIVCGGLLFGCCIFGGIAAMLSGNKTKDTTTTPKTTTITSKAGETTKQPAAVATETAAETTAAKTPTVVTVNELGDALDSNALKASNTYKGQYVELTGKLGTIDSSGKYFSLGRTDDKISFTSVLCNINKEHLAQVENFTDGQEVTVIGTITSVGEILGYSLDVETIK